MIDIAQYIDHTILKAEATPSQIETLCQEAAQYGFAAVCVNALFVPLAAKLLAETDVAVCTVVGFPLGATSTAAKCFEAEDALQNGATEIDMVIPVGLLKAGEEALVQEDIAAVVAVTHKHQGHCKVIIETALLSEAEKVKVCQLAQSAGADYVKTSTGFSTAGATVADVALMRQTVGPKMGLKAAGGIRDLATAQAMIEAGATRLGASAGVQIIQQAQG